jgi:hypothetical protein
MNLTDGDFEFVFNIYDEATVLINDKDKPEFASKVIAALVDHGFDIKPAVKEIADHCEYLSDAIDEYLELEEEDEDIFGDYNEDDEDEDY